MAIRLATIARNASANAVVDLLDAGAGAATLKIYSGARPATPNDTPAGTLLATVVFADPAFGNAGAVTPGVASATDPAAVTGVADGEAGCYVVEDSTGANVWDGTVTETGGGGDLELATTTISDGVSVDITSFDYTQPES